MSLDPSLAIFGLGIFGPSIASGLVAGAPQLGAGSAIGTAALAGGGLVMGGAAAIGGGRALAGAGLGAIRAGTSMGTAASTAYKLDQETSGSNSVSAGLGGVATAAKGAAANKMSGAFGISDAAERGRSAAWEAGVTRSTPAASPVSSTTGSQSDNAPAWAGQMRRDAANRTYRHAAIQSIKEGDRGGASATPDIKDKED